MKTYLLNRWDAARSSYWFVPSLCAAAAVILSLALPSLDAAIADAGIQLPESVQTTTDAARATLSAMAGAMVAVTGTVFSITIVTLSLASQQFGPRLLRRFMYDLPSQVTLGVFLSTGFYCLMVLRLVERHAGETASAPHLAVLAAVGLTVLSMAMLIVFIHHVAMLIQAPHVVAAVAQDLNEAIDRWRPESVGGLTEAAKGDEDKAAHQAAQLRGSDWTIRATGAGYIQAIGNEALMHLACEHQLILQLRVRPGAFISPGTPLVSVWLANDASASDLDSDDLTTSVNDVVIVGVRRTPRQDVECAIEELVEVAVRSLSPGINDPFTAMNCVDRLGAALGRMAERRPPSPYLWDDTSQLRIIANPVTFAGALDAAFNQIRQYGRDSVAVTIRLLEALLSIAGHLSRQDDRDAVLLHAEMTQRLSDAFAEERDRIAVRRRFDQIREALTV